MLHTPVRIAGEHVQRHVLSVKSAAEPEPNRNLSSGNQASSKSKTPIASPLSLKQSSPSRVSSPQHARACRFLSRFMDSILIRLLPVRHFKVDLSLTAPESCLPVYTSSPSNPSVSEVLGGLCVLLSADNRRRSASSEKIQMFGIPADPAAHTNSSIPLSSSFDSLCIEDSQLPTLESTISHSSSESEDEEWPASNSLMGMPLELILRIIGFVGNKQELLVLSRVSKDFRSLTLDESLWKPDLVLLATECKIGSELLARSEDYPSYLRWCAINRWVDLYREAKSLLDTLKPENRPSAESRDRFEALVSRMMPGVSPWAQPQYHLEEIEMTLPTTIQLQAREDLDAIQVFIELTHGVHRYELTRQGKPPVLEFLIHNPTRRRPTIICKTPGLYHPYLSETTNHLELPSSVCLPTDDSVVTRDAADSIRTLILAIRDAFTNLDSMASDFTL